MSCASDPAAVVAHDAPAMNAERVSAVLVCETVELAPERRTHPARHLRFALLLDLMCRDALHEAVDRTRHDVLRELADGLSIDFAAAFEAPAAGTTPDAMRYGAARKTRLSVLGWVESLGDDRVTFRLVVSRHDGRVLAEGRLGYVVRPRRVAEPSPVPRVGRRVVAAVAAVEAVPA